MKSRPAPLTYWEISGDREGVDMSDRVVLVLLAAVVAVVAMTALRLAAGAIWPDALSWGLGSGGATLVGLWTVLGKGDS
ncbi:hypothetical protein ACQPYK_22805 [Streptosporangium sp. CA-135522]|uniref:hypothetical protein n=1 Tax=Streptosporangium sp. CA-135522 TaxID=3240072 RepID=UPI003D909AC3